MKTNGITAEITIEEYAFLMELRNIGNQILGKDPHVFFTIMGVDVLKNDMIKDGLLSFMGKGK